MEALRVILTGRRRLDKVPPSRLFITSVAAYGGKTTHFDVVSFPAALISDGVTS